MLKCAYEFKMQIFATVNIATMNKPRFTVDYVFLTNSVNLGFYKLHRCKMCILSINRL